MEFISNEDMNSIKSIASEKELIDDDELDIYKNEKKFMRTDFVKFAYLTINCYDILLNNKHIFNNSVLSEMLNNVANKINDLKLLVRDYHNGNSIGDYYKRISIKNDIWLNGRDYEKVVLTFFGIFEE
jgi:hypothetical protein